MQRRKIPLWALAALGITGLIVILLPGLRVTGVLHPEPRSVPTVSRAAAPQAFAGAAGKARQLALEHLIERNLPGLSLAVGVRGGLVWAEGVGLADLRTNTPVTPEHRFPIGTASTVLASAAAGLLLEAGRQPGRRYSDPRPHVPGPACGDHSPTHEPHLRARFRWRRR